MTDGSIPFTIPYNIFAKCVRIITSVKRVAVPSCYPAAIHLTVIRALGIQVLAWILD